VSKLRENNKAVIGVGVKQSSSDLLISNCDEFIYYDDLVREDKAKAKRTRRKPQPKSAAKAVAAEAEPKPNEEARVEDRGVEEPKLDDESKREDKTVQALELVMSTLEALVAERGEDEKIWGSMIKQTLKRRHPGFNESYYGFKSFNSLLETAQARGLLSLERDEKSGGYIVRNAAHDVAVET
jgi:hypothetical protein